MEHGNQTFWQQFTKLVSVGNCLSQWYLVGGICLLSSTDIQGLINFQWTVFLSFFKRMEPGIQKKNLFFVWTWIIILMVALTNIREYKNCKNVKHAQCKSLNSLKQCKINILFSLKNLVYALQVVFKTCITFFSVRSLIIIVSCYWNIIIKAFSFVILLLELLFCCFYCFLPACSHPGFRTCLWH